jgi:hypothetical protein
MNGEMPITPLKIPATEPAPAPAPRAATAGKARAQLRPAGGERAAAAERPPEAAGAAEPGQQEATRLKQLLTDPAMRVSTHRDADSGHVVLRVQRQATGELVEQIPSAKLLNLYATMRESLIDEQA